MSVATNIIESIAAGAMHNGECPGMFPSAHLHAFVDADGRMRCFLRELARYIDAEEQKARKDKL